MANEPAGRHHPAPWIILGPVLFASLLSAGLALLAALGAPPWAPASGTAERPSAGPQAAGQRSGPPSGTSGTPPATTAATAVPLGAGPAPGRDYHPAPSGDRHPAGYQRSLLFSGMLGLAIAIAGMAMISHRRQMW